MVILDENTFRYNNEISISLPAMENINFLIKIFCSLERENVNS